MVIAIASEEEIPRSRIPLELPSARQRNLTEAQSERNPKNPKTETCSSNKLLMEMGPKFSPYG